MHQPHLGIGIITLSQMEYNVYIGGMGNDVCGILLGATVHLVCRNQERGESAKTEITRESSNEVLSY